MTNKGAIEWLKVEYENARCDECIEDEYVNALEMAIKALEQQPCEDCISREAVIEHICEDKECYKEECKGRILKRCPDLQWVFDLPPVTPRTNLARTSQDCISRRAVLDTIGNVPDYDDGMVWEALSHAQRDVALLPPVTPKFLSSTIIEIIIEMIDQEIEFYKSVAPDEGEGISEWDDGFISGMIHIKGIFRKADKDDREKER